MCKNATEQLSNLLLAERPTLVGIMELANVPADTQATVLGAYDAAQADAANWKPGETSTIVIEALNSALAVVESLKGIIPPNAEGLLMIVIGGIDAAITIIQANEKATSEEQQAVVAHASVRMETRIPGFKMNVFERGRAALGDTHVAANHYKIVWNDAVKKSDPKYAVLKQV